MTKNKKAICILTATSLFIPVLASVAKANEGSKQAGQDAKAESKQAVTVALDLSTSAMLSLILATTKVEQSAGRLVSLDPNVAKKYTYLRTAYLGGVPTSGVTISAGFMGVESVKRVEFALVPLTMLLRSIQTLGKISSDGIEKFSIATGLDKVLERSSERSGDSMKFTYEKLIEPVIRLLVNKHTMLSSGTSSLSASAGGSIFFLVNDSKEAMTVTEIRNLLGQDQVIRSRIEAEVRGIAEIYSLSAEQQSQLKIAIYDDVIRQAVENNFSEDSSKYSLDVLKLMAERKIVDQVTADAVLKIRSLVLQLSTVTVNNESTREMTIQNADVALQLAAIIESQIARNNVKDPALRAELERMLGSIAAKLAIVGFNIQK